MNSHCRTRGPRDRFYTDGDAAPPGHTQGRTCCGQRHRQGGAGRGALAEPAVLAALLSNAGHGYDLRKTIAEMTDDAIDVDQGGLYRVLQRLEAEGYVLSTWVDSDSGPRRREYELTPEAADLARDWIKHLREREKLAGMLADLLEASDQKTNPGGARHEDLKHA